MKRVFYITKKHDTVAFEHDDGTVKKYLPDDEYVKEYLVQGGVITEKFTEEGKLKHITDARYSRLEQIFNMKTLGLKRLAIDKPFMKNAEAINNQYRVYEEMYKNALAGRYDTATNDEIILANETAKAHLSDLTLLLNSVRAVIEDAILTNATNADTLLNTADAITLKKEDLTPEKLAEIKAVFGLQI